MNALLVFQLVEPTKQEAYVIPNDCSRLSVNEDVRIKKDARHSN